MSDITPRKYLVALGLAKEGRGKFSKEAHAALEAARAKGMVFAEPVKAAAKPRTPKEPKQATRILTAKVERPKVSGGMANPIRNKPVLRKQETRYAISPEGARVAYDQCFRVSCLNPISRCACADGPQPPKGATVVMGYPRN